MTGVTTSEKEDIIKYIYYDTGEGFWSLAETYKKAKAIDKSITYNFAKNYSNSLKHKQTKFQYKSYNSFVSPKPSYEIEIDLIDLTASAAVNNGYRYALVGIDNFTKYAAVIRIKTKRLPDMIKSLKELFENTGKPEHLYSDREGALTSNEINVFLANEGVKLNIVNSSAHTVEILNRTIKHKLQDRLDALNQERYKWIDHIDNR